ncbi:MAG: MurT ligase domain-containing protein [Methanosphaera sp.]|nr:MurT ligase domain-containing protein [Methanosphaera sp.]
MNIKHDLALKMGKLTLATLKLFNRRGTALPGKVALTIDKSFLEVINQKCDKIILVTGTNGKTTTNNLINHVLCDYNLLSNLRGANMRQGVASTYIRNTRESYDYGLFEVDEGSLDFVSSYLNADYIIITNFFRDQLDRYGEIESIINEVMEDIKLLPDSKLIINCDDPYVNQFKYKLDNEVIRFGLDIISDYSERNLILKKCPLCGCKLEYSKFNYGHLGNYNCPKCEFNNNTKEYCVNSIIQNDSSQTITINDSNKDYIIEYPYLGLYNAYNLCGVFALANELKLDINKTIEQMESFTFSLGRMEEFEYKDKTIKVILTKNPVGLSQVTRIISHDDRTKSIVHILNDNPADGRDVSWIWDANTSCTNDDTVTNYYCSGIRAEDMALKKKYDDVSTDKIQINDNMYNTINTAIEDDVEIVYVLPTYTAVFETRDHISKIVKR